MRIMRWKPKLVYRVNAPVVVLIQYDTVVSSMNPLHTETSPKLNSISLLVNVPNENGTATSIRLVVKPTAATVPKEKGIAMPL